MSRISGLLIFILILLWVSSATAFEKKRIIFYHVRNLGGVTLAEKRTLIKQIEKSLIEHIKFDLVSTGELEQVFKDIGISPEGCTATSCALKIMKHEKIGASYAMYGEIFRNEDGMIYITVSVVEALSESTCWQPDEFFKVPSINQIRSAAYAIINDFGKSIFVQPEINKISGNYITIDAGSELGIRFGQQYYVINEELIGVNEIIYDTLGTVKLTTVNKFLSRAEIIEKKKDFYEYSKLVPKIFIDEERPTIIHIPKEFCDQNTDLVIKAEISDNEQVADARFYYSNNDGANFEFIHMKKEPKKNNIYTGTIPKARLNNSRNLYYYILAKDNSGNKRVFKNTSDKPFRLKILIDTQKPIITYLNPDTKIVSDKITINPKVTDNIGVKEVNVFYKFQYSDIFKKIALEEFGKNSWGADVIISEGQSYLLYYITASDFNKNSTYFGSKNKPNKIKLKYPDISPPSITNIEFHKTVSLNNEYTITARITDNSSIKTAALTYLLKNRERNQAKTEHSISMKKIKDDLYGSSIIIDANLYKAIAYRIMASDGNNNFSKSIASYESFHESIKPDTRPPEISHYHPRDICLKPANYYKGRNVIYIVIFVAKDNVEVQETYAWIRKLDSIKEYKPVKISKLSHNSWGAFIEGPDRGIELYLEAIDSNNNTSYLGSYDNPYKIKIYQNKTKMAPIHSLIKDRNDKKE